MNKTGNFSKVQRMVILAVLIALTLVMALTPLGYLKIGALSISFLCIPIAIGATVLGPTAGLILGTLVISCGERTVGTIDLVSARSVQAQESKEKTEKKKTLAETLWQFLSAG